MPEPREDGRTLAPVSALIPTFNRNGTVQQAIASVVAQTWRPQEIVVVDDGSEDGTAEALAPLAEAGTIRLVRFERNAGQAAAWNAALAASSCEFVAVLSSDDLWLPMKTELQVRMLESDPGTGFVYGNDLWWDQETSRMWERFKDAGLKSGDLYEDLVMRRITLPLGSTMFRRSLIEEAGGWDERLRRHEDRDLAIRVARRSRGAVVRAPMRVVRAHGRELNAKDPKDTFPYEQWIDWERILVEKAVAEATDRGSAFARAVSARYHYVWGRGYLSRGRVRAARREFGASLAENPWSAKTWLFSAASLFSRERGAELPGG